MRRWTRGRSRLRARRRSSSFRQVGADDLREAAVGCLEPDDEGEVPEQRLPGIGLLERLLRRSGNAIEVTLEDGVDERVLRGEAAVEGAHPDVGAAGDLLHARVGAELGERPLRSLEDPLAVLSRVAAERSIGRCRVSGVHAPLMVGWAG